MEATHKGTQISKDLEYLDAIAWEIDQEYAAKLEGIIDMHVSSTDPNLPTSSSNNEHLLVPAPAGLDDESSDDEDTLSTTTQPTTSEQFAKIETRARAQADSGRQLRSGNVYASSATVQDGMYDASYREFIKTLICNTAPPDPADLHEQTRSVRTFARVLSARERRYERAFHAGVFHAPTPPDGATSAKHVQEAI